MNRFKRNILITTLLVMFIVTGCSNDDELSETIDNEVTEVTNDVALMDHQLIHQWTDLLLLLERYSSGRPNASARALAYIYLAAYETVAPGMEEYQSIEDDFRGLSVRQSERADEISWEIALNEAMEESLEHFLLDLPEGYKDQIDTFKEQIEESLEPFYSEQVISDSRSWGRYVARQVKEYSQSDKEAEEQIRDTQPLSYEPPAGEGYWTYSAEEERALYPYWGNTVRTFIISPDNTTTVEPIVYSASPTSGYYQQMLEVFEVNNLAKETDNEELWIAEFWSDDVEGLMMSPPARQISIANQLIEQYDLGIEESLALLLKVGFALNDAAVAAWKYKYDYMVMRPNVYIHEFIDPDFQTNLYRLVYWPNPSFPGYPSGHSCFASAAGGVFINFFGNETDFTDRTHEGRTAFRSSPRTFSSFEQMAEENAFSRIPLGVHIRMDCEEGLRLGYEIADAINNWDLRNPVAQ